MTFHRDLLKTGYLQVVEHWGSDERIVEAARMSTQKGFEGWGDQSPCQINPISSRACSRGTKGCDTKHVGDEKLLSFLYNNKHSTPFEMAGSVIEVKAPIMVFREWHRHRTQSYNEASARYGKLPDENYVPDPQDVRGRCDAAAKTANKQAQSTTQRVPTDDEISWWLQQLQEAYELGEYVYQKGLELGIPKELARLPVSVGRFSKMRASANLRNWIGFMALRSAPNAQKEIRVYSNALHDALSELFPRTMELVDAELKDFDFSVTLA